MKNGLNFIAFDIRSGGVTHDRLSEIAIVVVKDGEVVDKYFEEVTPPPNSMYINDFWQSHGERTLKEVWKDVKHYFEEVQYAVAFNLSVHKSNLEKSLSYYGIKLPEIDYVCAYNWAKNSIPLESATFVDVTNHLQIDLHQHKSLHLSQATATAELVLRLEEITGTSLEGYVNIIRQNKIEGVVKFFKSNINEADLNGLDFTNDLTNFNIDSKTTVITGDFEKFPNRNDLSELLTSKGALVKSAISGKTQVVILGAGAGPSKVEQIKELLTKGKSITLINQNSLYEYLQRIIVMVLMFGFFGSNTGFTQVIYKWQLQKSVTLLATKYELSKKGQVYYLKTTYEQDNSSANNAVILKKKGSKTIIEYKKKGSYGGEYHVIEPDGQLGLYNREGKRFGLAALRK